MKCKFVVHNNLVRIIILFDYTQIYLGFNTLPLEVLSIFHGNVPNFWERFHEISKKTHYQLFSN